MTAKYGVDNPLPPWKTSLDGLCDALDRSCAGSDQPDFTFKERRGEEDALSATRYANLPYPENQLVALAHSLVACGVIDETELQDRLAPSGPGWNPDRKTGCKQARQRVDRGP